MHAHDRLMGGAAGEPGDGQPGGHGLDADNDGRNGGEEGDNGSDSAGQDGQGKG